MTDNDCMREALEEARLAAATGEMPVGCVIALDGKIIVRAHNACEALRDATAHAELLAIRRAGAATGDWRLNRCTLYVTLEPCPMCAGAIMNAHIPKVYFGAYDLKNGSCGSVADLFDLPYTFKPHCEGGILQEECAQLLKDFFKKLR